MQDIYHLTWKAIPFTLTVTYPFMTVSDVIHLEVSATEALPITETGYKSIFLFPDQLPDITQAPHMILSSMNQTARDTKWHHNTQMSLF